MTRHGGRRPLIEVVCDADDYARRPACQLLRAHVLVDPRTDPPDVVVSGAVRDAARLVLP